MFRLNSDESNPRLQITVKDNGQGIEPEFLPFIFDRFRQADGTTTRAHGGLGLGLSIVRYLVEMHGGSVQAESAGAGKGSVFVVISAGRRRNGKIIRRTTGRFKRFGNRIERRFVKRFENFGS